MQTFAASHWMTVELYAHDDSRNIYLVSIEDLEARDQK